MKADVTSDNLLAKDLGPFIGARPGGRKASRRPRRGRPSSAPMARCSRTRKSSLAG